MNHIQPPTEDDRPRMLEQNPNPLHEEAKAIAFWLKVRYENIESR